MRVCVLLLLSLLCVCLPGVRSAPAEPVEEDQGCLDPAVLSVAERALDQINKHRTTGDVFNLNRVYDVSYQRRPHLSSPSIGRTRYSLSMEVWTTSCPVISRKTWKTCEVRDIISVPVYGLCEATVIETYDTSVSVNVLNYNCTIQRVPSEAIRRTCPDCPTGGGSLEDPVWAEVVNQCLEKFNSERTGSPAFDLMEFTQGSMQWMGGPRYFVEFTIKERTKDEANASKGFCKGYLLQRLPLETQSFSKEIFIGVKCDIYQPEEQEPGTNGYIPPHPSTAPHVLQGSVTVLPPPSMPLPSRPPPAAANCPGKRTTKLRLMQDCTASLVAC